MSELREHSNAWEAALEGLAVPPASTMWPSMEGLLDREMPVRRARKGLGGTPPQRGVGEGRRRAIWLLLGLLLLLIGVCNRCYEHRHGAATSSVTGSSTASTTPSAAAAAAPVGPTPAPTSATPTAPTPASVAPNRKDSELTLSGTPSRSGIPSRFGTPSRSGAPQPSGATSGTAADSGNSATPGSGRDSASVGQSSRPDSAVKSPSPTAPHSPSDTAGKKKVAKKPAPAVTRKTKTDEHGWLLGAGINQFLPVGDQNTSNYNSSGTTGNIRDYLPVPVVGYYFHRYLYVQLEAQLDAPQYTKALPVLADTTPTASYPQVSVDTLRKLFYFNLPVSIHYSPIKGLYVGAGMQFSRLTNAIGQSSSSQLAFSYLTGSLYDTTTVYEKVGTLKNTTAYHRFHTEEWRVLVDLNYQWKILTFGVQYNQALTPYITIPVAGNKITQYRNSSLQAYFRVALWRKMKIKQLKPKQPSGK